MSMGLVDAARHIESYGRGPDQTLAHISPDESAVMDYLQGGRRENPATGLPEYSLFGKILKAVARVAATTAGFMYGGPMGAAAANAAATKLTGGSWKQAGIGAATAGLTGGLANYAQGVRGFGELATTTGNSLVQNAAAANFALGGVDAATPAAAKIAAQGLVPTATPSIGQAITNAGTLASAAPLAAGSFALSNALPAFQERSSSSKDTAPPPEETPYVGGVYSDDYKYGVGKHGPDGPRSLADIPGLGSKKWADAELAKQRPSGQNAENIYKDLYPGMYAVGGPVPSGGGVGASPDQLMSSSEWGYVNAKHGGTINGPGTGTSDEIPAMLSDGEHVYDAQTVTDAAALAGRPGDNDAGQQVMEDIKQTIRKMAGRKNPKSPTSPMAA
jgi:hypothetical protein